MVKTNGMLAGADYFLSHVSLVFDDRKSQPLIAGAVRADTRSALRPQFAANVTIWWRAGTIVLNAERQRLHRNVGDKALKSSQRRCRTIHQVQSDLLPPSSLISVSSFTSVSSFSVRNVNTATVTATS